MATKKDIDLAFQELNYTLDDHILNKCLELCKMYNIKAEEFCDQWYAFTASHLNGAAPSIDHLDKMERRVLHKGKYEEIEEKKKPIEFENAVLTPQSKKKEKSILTPIIKTPVSNTPVSNTPVSQNTNISINSSESFLKRTDSRSVQRSFGYIYPATFKRVEDNIVFKIIEVEKHQIEKDFICMYQIVGKKAKIINDIIYNLGHDILDKNRLILPEDLLINQTGDTITYGRIVSDSDRTLNSQSILLEGSDQSNLNYTTRLNINKVSNYSLFPGQVVVVKGNYVKNQALVAKEIFTTADLELPEEAPLTTSTTQIVVAAGPFTFTENLSYEPLHELLNYVNENKPHVLILTGPFLDATNNSVANGDITQTFDSLFEDLICNIMNSVQPLDVNVVIVSSYKDVHHLPVYPTLRYNIREKFDKLTFVCDPGVIEINGLRIATTTADILLHMSGFEIHFDRNAVINTGRLERMASHLLHQKNMYPLYPPHKDICIDFTLLGQYGILNVKPHILILPSTLKTFVKDVDDCLIINPERLTKGLTGGTFARIEIAPGSTRSICSRVKAQILKI